MLWHLTRPEIQYWFDQKDREFAVEEIQNSGLMTEEWLGLYLCYDIHDYFFSEFPIILYEWMVQLIYGKENFQGGEPT